MGGIRTADRVHPSRPRGSQGGVHRAHVQEQRHGSHIRAGEEGRGGRGSQQTPVGGTGAGRE